MLKSDIRRVIARAAHDMIKMSCWKVRLPVTTSAVTLAVAGLAGHVAVLVLPLVVVYVVEVEAVAVSWSCIMWICEVGKDIERF